MFCTDMTHIATKKSIDISHFSPYDVNLYIQKKKTNLYQTASQATKHCSIRSVKSILQSL